MNHLYKHILLLPIFVLVQVLILNNILFSTYINPFIVLSLIIVLPQNTEKWFLIIYAFLIGLSLDLFEGSLGLHSSAMVLIAFLKPQIEKISIAKNSVDEKDDLNLQILGLKTFSVYSFLFIFTHHTFLFLLEHFSLSFGMLFVKIILNSIITYVLISIIQLFGFKQKK